MNIVTGAIGSLLNKLGKLLKKEFNLQRGVKDQIRSLSLELESAHAALSRVAQVPPDQLDEQVRIWAREVREASYDMEDVIDAFLVRVEGCEPADADSLIKRVQKKVTALFKKTKECHKIGGMIADIKDHLQEVTDRRGRYTVDTVVTRPAATSTIDPRLEAMYKEVKQLIGMDKSKGELISMLLPDGDEVSNKKMKMVSVVGVGGLGKTTLAKVVYDKLRQDFDCGAFVPVGQNPDLKKVLRDIVIDLYKNKYTGFNMMTLDERQLINELQGFLANKRYLIVIDDVWETFSWEIIKLALVDSECGSRVIITTRKVEVATVDSEIYNLQPLSYDNSKMLLHTRIFGGDSNCHDNHSDEFFDKILKKCGGIPLAVITMASLLVGKPREQWSTVYNGIGLGDRENRQMENTIRILSFSYYDLPCHLKTCLLYLSAFPEDSVISKDTLIWMWIAEGLVHENQGIRLFEVGEDYFNILINRGLIQALESKVNGIIYGCCVHDMVLDLIRSLARAEIFFTILDSGHGALSQGKVRRLAPGGGDTPYQDSHMDMSGVRSFISCRCDNIKKWDLLTFKFLRVLSIEECYFTDGYHFEFLVLLLHLRYLSLKGTLIRELPKEIGALKLLQALYLTGSEISELPSSCCLLTQLLFLRCNSWSTRAPDGIGHFKSLEELVIYPGDDEISLKRFVKELGVLEELRVLKTFIRVMDESTQMDLVDSLCNLHKMQHLELNTFTEPNSADMVKWKAANFELPPDLQYLSAQAIRFPRLPSCISLSHLPNLFYLSLNVDGMDEQSLKSLGGLPGLRFLKLITQSALLISDIALGGYFQKLRFCYMYCANQALEKEDTKVSCFTYDARNGSPRKKDVCNPTVMPCLELLHFDVHVRALNDCNGNCGSLVVENIISLESVSVVINCQDATAAEVEEVASALRNSIDNNPNHPQLVIGRMLEHKIAPSIEAQEPVNHNLATEDDNEDHEEDPF